MHLLHHVVTVIGIIPDRTDVAAIVQARILKILGLNLHFDTNLPDIFVVLLIIYRHIPVFPI
jgi:hypothetical protein